MSEFHAHRACCQNKTTKFDLKKSVVQLKIEVISILLFWGLRFVALFPLLP